MNDNDNIIDAKDCSDTCNTIWNAVHAFSDDSNDQMSIMCCIMFRLCEEHGMPVHEMMNGMVNVYNRERAWKERQRSMN